jgi:hypothetical protein
MPANRFYVSQKFTLMVNRYRVMGANPDGSEGPLLAFAQQKRMKIKEEINFFTDESMGRKVFSFRARQRLDVHAEHDVYDEHGRPLGYFKKQFGKSLFRSTWELQGPGGLHAIGTERRPVIAVLRRIWDFIPYLGDIWVPFVFHFDFYDQNGNHVMTSERIKSLRDRYLVTVSDPRLDFRVAASMAVALDALQSR